MQIFMLETRRGSEDALVVRRFEKGRHYKVTELLGRAFIAAGWAIACRSESKEGEKGIRDEG